MTVTDNEAHDGTQHGAAENDAGRTVDSCSGVYTECSTIEQDLYVCDDLIHSPTASCNACNTSDQLTPAINLNTPTAVDALGAVQW